MKVYLEQKGYNKKLRNKLKHDPKRIIDLTKFEKVDEA